MSLDARRLAAVISPLRRALLSATRRTADLPDIPDAQIEVVRVLLGATPSTPSEVASTLGVSRSTVSNLLLRMERAGLVVRAQDESDGRGIQILPSDVARSRFAEFDRTSAAIVQEAVEASLSSAEAKVLAEALPILEKLREAIAERKNV